MIALDWVLGDIKTLNIKAKIILVDKKKSSKAEWGGESNFKSLVINVLIKALSNR